MEYVALTFGFAFLISAGFNIRQAMTQRTLRDAISERDSIIADLESTMGGVEREDWRSRVL